METLDFSTVQYNTKLIDAKSPSLNSKIWNDRIKFGTNYKCE